VVCVLVAALLAPGLQQHSLLWLGLLQDILQCSPSHAGLAGLLLPLATPAPASAAAREALQELWQRVTHWTASDAVQGTL
jgi:hypothetical protein